MTHDALFLACEAIKQNVSEAVKFLKTRLPSFKAFQQMPWYLVIGKSQSGKTEFISKSELNFLETEKFVQLTPEGMKTQSGVNWWFSPGAVLIDVPGSYLEETTDLTEGRASWFELLRQIRRFRFRRPINGIIITIDINSLQKNEELLFLRTRCQEILHRLKQRLPIYLIITQTDYIQGFTEYFDDLGKLEREQLFGLTFPLQAKSKLSWMENFSEEFDKLISHLHQRVLWRIHQEREPFILNLILNFPQQLNSLKENLNHLINDLSSLHAHTILRGIYFTSNLKNDSAIIDNIGETVEKHFALMPQKNAYISQRPQHAYFIKTLFEEKIFPESNLAHQVLRTTASHQDDLLRWGALGFAGIILLSVTFGLSRHYERQVLHLNKANTAISDYKLLTLTNGMEKPELDKLLTILDSLQIANQNAKLAKLPWLLRFQLHHEESLPTLTDQLYNQALQTKLIPLIRDQIAEQLQKGDVTDSSQLYEMLKVYLMLGDPEHENKKFLQHWFQTEWQNPLMQNKHFRKHWDVALNNPMPILSPDVMLIQRIRATLNALPYPLLTQAILQSEYEPSVLKIDNPNNIFIMPKISIPTPTRFTSEQVNDALYIAIDGNWVLGDKVGGKLSPENLNDLKNNLTNEYNESSKTYLSQIQIKSFASLNELDVGLSLLSTHAEFKRVSGALINLDAHIKEIIKSQNPGAKALEVAGMLGKQKESDPILALIKQANVSPEPLKSWTLSIANQSRDLIFKKASLFALEQWQIQVLPLCQKMIEHHYPFDKSSSQEISLSDFSRFFERGGIFNQYFDLYLSPLVDTSEARWRWKNIDGGVFESEDHQLIQLERANIIQELYFNKKNQLITPFTLNLNNNSEQYIWPVNTEHLSVILTNNNGEQKTLYASGEWSIFRLMDMSEVKPQKDGATYNLFFKDRDFTATYQLSASPLNPFIKGVIESFRCS
jgi:type VI protein secretion system component VasK